MTIRLILTDAQLAVINAYLASPNRDIPASRLRVVLLSAQGYSTRRISEAVNLHQINVRKWIHRYEQDGIKGLRTRHSPGRPPLFDAATRRDIIKLYNTQPRKLGLPFHQWSLARLRNELIERKVVEKISVEAIRGYLREAAARA